MIILSADGLVWLQPASQFVPMIIRDNDSPSTSVLGNNPLIVFVPPYNVCFDSFSPFA